MKNFLKIPVMALAVGMLGCASNGQVHQIESASETNTRLLRENEQRLKNLETSVSSLNSQVAQLNNRVYEVRTRNGKKTSMTVVPIVPPTQAPAVSPATAAAAPTGASSAPAATAAAANPPVYYRGKMHAPIYIPATGETFPRNKVLCQTTWCR